MFLSRNDQIELLSNYCYRTLLPQDVYEFLVNLQSQCEHWETPMSTYTKESVQENLINRVFKDASLDDSIKISTLQTYFNNWEIGDGFDGSEKIVDDFLIVFESLLMEGKIDFSCELARGLEISSSFNFTLIEPWICLWIAYDSVNQYDRLLPSLAENKAEYREELRQRLLELVKSLSNPEYPAVLIRHLPEILIPMLFKCIQFEEPEMALELSQVLSNPESGQRLVSGFSLAEIQNFIFGSAIAFGLSRQRISPPFTAPLLPPSSFHHNQ